MMVANALFDTRTNAAKKNAHKTFLVANDTYAPADVWQGNIP